MARARITGLMGLLTLAGCYEQMEPPPLTGPCAFWTTSVEGVRTNDRDASFTRLGGALELRQFWVRRNHEAAALVTDIAYGEVENIGDVVMCEGDAILHVDGARFSPVFLWGSAYDDGSETSLDCLAPGERGLFRAWLGGTLAGDRTPIYSRVEYDFGAVPRADVVPHPLAPELVDVTWTDDAPGDARAQVTMRMRSDGLIADLWVDLFARDACGVSRHITSFGPESAGGDFDVTVDVDLDESESSLVELLPFVRFRRP